MAKAKVSSPQKSSKSTPTEAKPVIAAEPVEIPLTGKALLQRLKELSPLAKRETAKECGYVRTSASGNVRTDLSSFYDAVLAAKGVKLDGKTARKPKEKPQLENRVASLETELSQMKELLTIFLQPDEPPSLWWEQVAGSFENDPDFDEAVRLGQEWRKTAE